MEPSSSLSSFIIFSILIALPLQLQAKKVSLEQNCKRISTANISQASCLEYFKADPGSKNTNLHVLGAIAFKRTLQNATDVQSVIQGHIGSDSSDAARLTNSAMKNCLAYYTKVAEPAKEALKKYEAKEYRDSAALVRQLDSAPTDCEKDCKSKQVQSPLGPDNDGFRLNVLISSRIADLLAAKKSKKTGKTTGQTTNQTTGQMISQTTGQTTGQTINQTTGQASGQMTDQMAAALKELPPQRSKEDWNCDGLLLPIGAPKIPREFCTAVFTHDPSSKSIGGLTELATFMFQITINNATGMLANIDKHLKTASGAVKSSLEECGNSYNLGLGIAKKGLELFEKKEYKLSRDEAVKVVNSATTCENAFTQQKVQSPLTKENESFRLLSLMLKSATEVVVEEENADEKEKTIDERGPDEE